MPGLNYARWSAALIPPKGILFGAIIPAIICWRANAQKKPSKAPGMFTPKLPSGVDAANGSSAKTIGLNSVRSQVFAHLTLGSHMLLRL